MGNGHQGRALKCWAARSREARGRSIMARRQSAPADTARAVRPLEALNFFMADMQAGIGPFLGVFLLAHGCGSGLIGTVMTIGGVAGMVMTAPAGALVDATSHKRFSVIVPGVCTVLASMIILLWQNF